MNGDIDAIAQNWRVWSQKNSGQSYTVISTGDERCCTCRDFQNGAAPRAEGRIFCKHLIAISAYTEILRNHLASRLAGSSRDRSTRELLRLYPGAYLMRIDYTSTITNLERDAIRFQVCWGTRGTTFASDQDAIIFSHWLADARPRPKMEPDHYEQPTPPPRAQATWTRQQWQHWYATGETPALAAS